MTYHCEDRVHGIRQSLVLFWQWPSQKEACHTQTTLYMLTRTKVPERLRRVTWSGAAIVLIATGVNAVTAVATEEEDDDDDAVELREADDTSFIDYVIIGLFAFVSYEVDASGNGTSNGRGEGVAAEEDDHDARLGTPLAR